MKHTLKAAAAAVALAISAGASAQYVAGDLVIQVYDPASGDTLVADLGTPVQTAVGSSAIVDSIAGYSAFTGTAGVGTSANFIYTVVGTNNQTGGTGDVGTAVTLTTGPNKTTMASLFGSGILGPETSNLSTSSYAILASGATGAFITQNTYFGAGGLVNVNDPTNLYYFSAPSSVKSTVTLVDPLSFNAAAGTLTIGTASATPEPGTYALMLAGLLAVGTIVRRRRA